MINICMIIDENYVKPMAVAISSAICNKNPNTKYNFYIVNEKLSDNSKKLFKQFETNSTIINFIEVENIMKDEQIYSHVPQSALIKFQLAEIFKDLDKIIYLDSDIIVQKDLSDLFNIDLDTKYAAVVRDIIGEEERGLHDLLGVNYYFNSGVMLLNLSLMRTNNTKEELIKARLEHKWTSLDQDPLNVVFNNNIILLDVKYNAQTGAMKEFKYDIDKINKFYNTSYSSISELESDTIINHFAGCYRIRPWNYMDGIYAEQWTYYYMQSPFRHIALERKVHNALIYPKLRPILKSLFSITNGKKCKILTILGLKIKFSRSNKY